MKPFVNDPGMRAINFAKSLSAAKLGDGHMHTQSHAGFAFLLDYVPNWKHAYKPGGLIQYQSFVPKETCPGRLLRTDYSWRRRMASYPIFGVFKRHRPDDFLMTHAVDGYSLALDFAVTPAKQGALLSLAAEMDRLVLDAGGRFYFAKDSALHRSAASGGLGRRARRKVPGPQARVRPGKPAPNQLVPAACSRVQCNVYCRATKQPPK